MMPCAPLMKPKLGFSIESLVGGKGGSEGRGSPPLADTCSDRGVSPPTSMPPSPLSPGPPAFSDLRAPLAMRALLEDKPLPIQRPQPINGATQRPSQEVSLPPSLLAAAKLPTGFPPALLPHQLNLAALPQLQGLPGAFPPHLNPLMMGGNVPGLAAHLPREYPLYPWLLSRHGRVFPHGLPSEYLCTTVWFYCPLKSLALRADCVQSSPSGNIPCRCKANFLANTNSDIPDRITYRMRYSFSLHGLSKSIHDIFIIN